MLLFVQLRKSSGKVLKLWCKKSWKKWEKVLESPGMSWSLSPWWVPCITRLRFFSSKIIYFLQKEPIKVQILSTFECLGQNFSNYSCQFWNNKSNPLQILHHSSVSWNITLLYFLAQTCTFFKRSSLKWKFFRILRDQVKFSNFPCEFETASQFFFKFCIILQCHDTQLLCEC